MKERRKHDRRPARESAVVIELRYAVANCSSETRRMFCSTADLSNHGLRLNLDRYFDVNTPLQITVIFKDPPRHFQHVGIVRWVREDLTAVKFFIGVEFLPSVGRQQKEWAAYLADHFPAIAEDVFTPPAV